MGFNEVWQTIVAAAPELWLRTGEHLMLTGVSMTFAVLIGVPLGIYAAHQPRLQATITSVVGVLQTIPSLAMLALLLALTGQIGVVPAIIALTLYALLPIVSNTVSGITNLPRSYAEVAHAVGMRPFQRLTYVELPLASDVILAGIRTAAVICVGIATLSAFIGAGGLGQFINRGLALRDTELILLGAIPAAIMAVAVDLSLQGLGWGLRRRHSLTSSFWQSLLPGLRVAAVAAPFLILATGLVAYVGTRAPSSADAGIVRVGSKNFSEQLLLSEIVAQTIEGRTTLRVDRRFNLGGTMIAHGALAEGAVDLYVEYTGTGLTAILDLPPTSDPDEAFRIVREAYAEQFDAVWLPPLGFNNTFAIAVRGSDARANGWTTLSDLEGVLGLRAGFGPEFIERPDGLPGLLEVYDLEFASIVDLELAFVYDALAEGAVDIVSANATDGRLAAFDLTVLADDRGFFPPYYAAPVVRRETLERYPSLRLALETLAGRIDDARMQALNFEVDGKGRTPADVAREFLVSEGLIRADEAPAPLE